MTGIAFLAAGLFGLVLFALYWMWWRGVVQMNYKNAASSDRHCPVCSAKPAYLCEQGGDTLMLYVHRARAWGRK